MTKGNVGAAKVPICGADEVCERGVFRTVNRSSPVVMVKFRINTRGQATR
jgi:hypothetical protein